MFRQLLPCPSGEEKGSENRIAFVPSNKLLLLFLILGGCVGSLLLHMGFL